MSAYDAMILAEAGLVSYWRLGEASGSAVDSKDSNPGTTIVGGVTRNVPGLIINNTDGAASCDGTTSSRIVIPYSASLNPGARMTVEAWVKPISIPITRTITGQGTNAGTQGWGLSLTTSGGYSATVWSTASSFKQVATGNGLASVGTVQHVVLVYDSVGGSMSIYVNGVQQGNTTGIAAAVFAATEPMAIFSGFGDAGSASFNGVVDEVAFYNVALTPARILAHYQTGAVPFVAPAAQARAQAVGTVFAPGVRFLTPTAGTKAQASATVTAPLTLDPLAIFDVSTIAAIETADDAPEPPALLDDVPPFEWTSQQVQTVLRVVANELYRIEVARQALILNFFPATADVLLGMFESLLGLPVEPPATLDARRQLVLAYMQRLKSEGRGLDWIAQITAAVGTTNWNYAEHDPANVGSPAANTVNVNIPQATAGYAWPLITDITPAHLVINKGYTGGFIVGSTPVWPGGAGNTI